MQKLTGRDSASSFSRRENTLTYFEGMAVSVKSYKCRILRKNLRVTQKLNFFTWKRGLVETNTTQNSILTCLSIKCVYNVHVT